MSARRVLGACVRFKGVHNLIPAPRAVSRWQGRSPAVLKPTSCRHQAASARAHSTAPASALAGVEAREADGTLVVSWSDGAAAGFHAEWLRDHCQCAGCFDHRTLQRRTDIAAWGDADGRPCSHLSAAQVHDAEDAAGVMVDGPGAAAASMELQEAAAAAVARGGTNFVTATVGGGAAAHRVVLSGSFLRRHAYWPVNDAAKRAGFDTGAWERDAEDMRKALPLESFGADSFAAGAGLPSLTVEELKSAENGVFRLLRDLHVHGIVAVTGVAPTVEATEEVVRCISFPSATLYGSGMWLTEIRDGGDIDTAYTADGLPPHTDGTYFGDMPGVQVFHSIVDDLPRGKTLLVDGLRVCEVLREHYPAAFEFFSTTTLPFGKRDDTHDMRETRRVITLDDAGSVVKFAFNDVDRAPIHLPPEVMPQYYEHLRDITRVARDERNSLWVGLSAGTVLLMDNQRVMHGRSAFNTNSGRTLSGCYIDEDEVRSRLIVEFRAARRRGEI